MDLETIMALQPLAAAPLSPWELREARTKLAHDMLALMEQDLTWAVPREVAETLALARAAVETLHHEVRKEMDRDATAAD